MYTCFRQFHLLDLQLQDIPRKEKGNFYVDNMLGGAEMAKEARIVIDDGVIKFRRFHFTDMDFRRFEPFGLHSQGC